MIASLYPGPRPPLALVSPSSPHPYPGWQSPRRWARLTGAGFRGFSGHFPAILRLTSKQLRLPKKAPVLITSPRETQRVGAQKVVAGRSECLWEGGEDTAVEAFPGYQKGQWPSCSDPRPAPPCHPAAKDTPPPLGAAVAAQPPAPRWSTLPARPTAVYLLNDF